MTFVRPKKHLGQHFLADENIAKKIVSSLSVSGNVLEIGPGMGVLTKHLLEIPSINLNLIEIDRESVAYLEEKYPQLNGKIISADFLKYDSSSLFNEPYAIIGNFPYNISSQILFRVLENKNQVTEVVGMFQKEVARRIASAPGSKEYGILSVLMKTFYTIEYLFTVNESVFIPPPRVKSAVIRLIRNDITDLGCNENLFFEIVKKGFNQRRKTLRNALSSFEFNETIKSSGILTKRAEQLEISDFIELAINVKR